MLVILKGQMFVIEWDFGLICWYRDADSFTFSPKRPQLQGVNFINILHTNFSYKDRFSSFFYVHVTRGKLQKQCLYKKIVHKMLMKLTKGVIQIIRDSPRFNKLSGTFIIMLKEVKKSWMRTRLWQVRHLFWFNFSYWSMNLKNSYFFKIKTTWGRMGGSERCQKSVAYFLLCQFIFRMTKWA